jgi:hypothetical protein
MSAFPNVWDIYDIADNASPELPEQSYQHLRHPALLHASYPFVVEVVDELHFMGPNGRFGNCTATNPNTVS